MELLIDRPHSYDGPETSQGSVPRQSHRSMKPLPRQRNRVLLSKKQIASGAPWVRTLTKLLLAANLNRPGTIVVTFLNPCAEVFGDTFPGWLPSCNSCNSATV